MWALSVTLSLMTPGHAHLSSSEHPNSSPRSSASDPGLLSPACCSLVNSSWSQPFVDHTGMEVGQWDTLRRPTQLEGQLLLVLSSSGKSVGRERVPNSPAQPADQEGLQQQGALSCLSGPGQGADHRKSRALCCPSVAVTPMSFRRPVAQTSHSSAYAWRPLG